MAGHFVREPGLKCFPVLCRPKQFATRKGEQSSRARRARPRGTQASSHEHLGLFQRQLGSPSSPPGEDLTTGDMFEDEEIYEEQGEGFDEGEDVEERQLRDAELRVDRRISRQVKMMRWFHQNNLFIVAGDADAVELQSTGIGKCSADPFSIVA